MIIRSQAEISRKLGCSRANVGQSLRRSIKKMYKNILKENLASSPFEAFEYLTGFLNLECEEDINEFFKTMPKNIKEEIENDATSRYM